MKLIRFRLAPVSSWVTPWQADTLMGALACVYAREAGPEALEADLLTPWRTARPPFVLSDAFPGDLLPAPACLGLWDWADSERKTVKRTAWLTRDQFREWQAGRKPKLSGDPVRPWKELLRMRNTLDRASDTTDPTGTLYGVPVTAFGEDYPDRYLSVYAAVEDGREGWLRELFEMLAGQGFGADSGVGQGQFDLAPGFDDADWLTQLPGATGWVSLSTYQPGRNDSRAGYWRSFIKYGRMGPDLDVDVFKRPQWMLRAGAAFQVEGAARDWYGRWIGAEELLPESTGRRLAEQGIAPGQPAFALAVPSVWAPTYWGIHGKPDTSD